MIVVSDTSPITALLQIDHEDLLPALYGTVFVPPAVERELKVIHSLPAFLRCKSPKNLVEVERLKHELDRGEAEAIVLAKELTADLLLIDEVHGRAIATREGIRVLGLLGMLVEAKRRGNVTSVRELVSDLERIAGFRASAEVKSIIFKAANE
jgi:predicted nucleic acid-binding protein